VQASTQDKPSLSPNFYGDYSYITFKTKLITSVTLACEFGNIAFSSFNSPHQMHFEQKTAPTFVGAVFDIFTLFLRSGGTPYQPE
jgi:hypothetical protein